MAPPFEQTFITDVGASKSIEKKKKKFIGLYKNFTSLTVIVSLSSLVTYKNYLFQ